MQETLGVETKPIQLITKILPIMDHFMSTAFGDSKYFYGGRRRTLTGAGQGNVVSVNMCRYSSCIILRDIEKNNLGFFITSPLTEEIVRQLEISFVDDNNFASDENHAEKIVKILKRHTQLCKATAGRFQFDKTYFFSWR